MKQTPEELMNPEKDGRGGRREKIPGARQLPVPCSGGLTTLRPVEPVLREQGAALPTTLDYVPGKPWSWREAAVFSQERVSLRSVWGDGH